MSYYPPQKYDNGRFVKNHVEHPTPFPFGVTCVECNCVFYPDIKTEHQGEIEIRFFKCPDCGKMYPISATDEQLRQDIARYAALEEPDEELLNRNRERAAELKRRYFHE